MCTTLRNVLLAHLFFLLSSLVFSQTPDPHPTYMELSRQQKVAELQLLDEWIRVQRLKIDSLAQRIEVGQHEAAYFRAQLDSIEVIKATMRKYIRQIDSLNSLNAQLALLDAKSPLPELSHTAILIDYVQYLPESGEYALSLEFLPEVDQVEWYRKAETAQYEVVYSVDPEYVHYRVPEEDIRAYFHTDRLGEVLLYDRENRVVGRGVFQEYAFLAQNVESKTVAVFRLSEASADTAFFAIGGWSDTLPALAPKRDPDNTAYRDLRARVWPADHDSHYPLEVALDEFHWMVLQGWPKEADDNQEIAAQVRASLYLEYEGGIKQVHRMDEGWLYWHVQPLSISWKGYPVLLLERAMIDSDWFQTRLLLWNGEVYEEFHPYLQRTP